MSDITVRELTLAEMPLAGDVLGRGLRDNPLHVRVAGSDPAQREKFFGRVFGVMLAIAHPKGTVLGAFRGERLAGVCTFVPPGHCQPTGAEKVRLMAAVAGNASFGASLTAMRWLGAVSKHDPQDKPHWHLGPFAVEPELQRQGIGTQLLRAACLRVDAAGGVTYLENDKEANRPFFEKFSFKTVAQAEVLDVPNWFMLRPARTDTARWAAPPPSPQYSLPKLDSRPKTAPPGP